MDAAVHLVARWGFWFGARILKPSCCGLFQGMPFKATVGMVLGGCWGEMGEVRVRVWLPIQSRAGGSRVWAKILKPSCCGSVLVRAVQNDGGEGVGGLL